MSIYSKIKGVSARSCLDLLAAKWPTEGNGSVHVGESRRVFKQIHVLQAQSHESHGVKTYYTELRL